MTRRPPLSAYHTLGVTPEDDFATIRKAWRQLVRENHPDVAGEEGLARLVEINEAYDALTWHPKSPSERAAPRKSRRRPSRAVIVMPRQEPVPVRTAPVAYAPHPGFGAAQAVLAGSDEGRVLSRYA